MTILTAASNTSSVYNEMLFVVSDPKTLDEVTYPNYKYILDVYVDDVFVARLKATPKPDNLLGVFDVSNVLQGYAPDAPFTAASNNESYDILINYKIKLGEEYDATTYTNLVFDVNSRSCFTTFKKRPFTSTTVVQNGIASNMPSPINSYGDTPYQFIPFFSNVSGVSDFTATFYDSNNNSLGSTNFSNAGIGNNILKVFNVAKAFTSAAYCLFTGTHPNGSFSQRIVYNCTRYPVKTLVWLNQYGGYESQNFGFVSRKTIDLSKKDYGRLNYDVADNGTVSYQTGNVMYGGRRVFTSNVMTRMRLTSHLLNDNEYTWLADLFISPNVFIYDDTVSLFVPCKIVETSYDFKTYLNNRLTPLDINVEFSDTYNAQNL